MKTNGDFTTVNLTILPVAAASCDDSRGGQSAIEEQTLYLVVLEEEVKPGQDLPAKSGVAGTVEGAERNCADIDVKIEALRQELRLKEEYLQRNIEELDSSNEEMQSVNEELATVNSELQAKVIDLSRANNDMNNLLAGTDIGMIFVDHQLSIQRFTPAITQVVNLILSDVGRPLGHIVSNLDGYDSLVKDVQAVLDTLAPKELEVRTTSGDWFLLRIRPYRTLENVIEGAVITFVNIMEIEQAREVSLRLASIVKNAHDAILLQDFEGRILAWNTAAQRMYGWSEAEALAMNLRDLIPEELREQELVRVRQLIQNELLEPYRTERIA